MKITKITFTTFPYGNYNYEGVVIELDNGEEIKIGIDGDQQCCEEAGFLSSNDEYDDFIGADFLKVLVVDTNNCVKELKDIYEPNVIFVNVETSNGTLQFVAYNDHNGYYGHDVIILNGATRMLEVCL